MGDIAEDRFDDVAIVIAELLDVLKTRNPDVPLDDLDTVLDYAQLVCPTQGPVARKEAPAVAARRSPAPAYRGFGAMGEGKARRRPGLAGRTCPPTSSTALVRLLPTGRCWTCCAFDPPIDGIWAFRLL